MNSIRGETVALDPNVFIFALRKEPNFPACETQLFDKLNAIRVYMPLQIFLEQELRGCSHPLQGWQCELSALEDEAPLELPPGALLVETFAFHNEIRHEA